MKRHAWFALVGLLTGCGEDDSSRPVEICVHRYSLAQYRAGDGPWVTATADAHGAHTLEATDDFEFVGVTAAATFTYVTLWRSTVREWSAERTNAGSSAELACGPAVPTYAAVTGTLAQPGTISIDSVSARVDGPARFTLYVEPGTYDLVASSATSGSGGSVLIQRELPLTAPTMLTLDTAQGVEVMPRPIDVSNASEIPFVSTHLLVDGGMSPAEISGRGDGMVDVLPASALAPDDEQWIYVYAPEGGAEIRYTGTVPVVDLLPPLADVTQILSNEPGTSWTKLPADYDHVSITIEGETSDGRVAYQDLYASRGWNEAHGATSLNLPGAIPGFDPRWSVSQFTLSRLFTRLYMPPRDGVTLWARDPNGTL